MSLFSYQNLVNSVAFRQAGSGRMIYKCLFGQIGATNLDRRLASLSRRLADLFTLFVRDPSSQAARVSAFTNSFDLLETVTNIHDAIVSAFALRALNAFGASLPFCNINLSAFGHRFVPHFDPSVFFRFRLPSSRSSAPTIFTP